MEIHPRKKGPLFLCPNIGAITEILLNKRTRLILIIQVAPTIKKSPLHCPGGFISIISPLLAIFWYLYQFITSRKYCILIDLILVVACH
jgi:hypothetical protein